MNGYVTTSRYARCLDLPVCLPQTELRAAKRLQIFTIQLRHGQRLELRSLTMSLLSVLTPGAVPTYLNAALSTCSVGLYAGNMITSPLAYTGTYGGATTVNPFSTCVVETPGTYGIIVSNNTANTDLSVAVTGSIKLFA